MYPKAFNDLIEVFKRLPGVGSKTAERYAYCLLNEDEATLKYFSELLADLKSNIKYCKICHNMCDDDLCDICKNENRDHNIICVVESTKDVNAMEKTGEFHGVYHVLNGLISANKGILPENINIDTLLKRINSNTKEIIIATNPNIDGETTALYISNLLKEKNVLVTRLAYGLPMGGHLDYADEMTLIKAIEGRKKL